MVADHGVDRNQALVECLLFPLMASAAAAVVRIFLQPHGGPALGTHSDLNLLSLVLEGQKDIAPCSVIHEADGLTAKVEEESLPPPSLPS